MGVTLSLLSLASSAPTGKTALVGEAGTWSPAHDSQTMSVTCETIVEDSLPEKDSFFVKTHTHTHTHTHKHTHYHAFSVSDKKKMVLKE